MLDEVTATPGVAGAPGDVIAGKYQLEQVLGEGGMGVVWRARNLALDLPVAIKVMSHVAADRRVLRERLLLEAKAAARVTHPAIVKVFDVAQTERDEPFIVMELLVGTSLGAILAREGRILPTQAVSVLLPIAEALKAAHEHGIVHRDVKPDNILIAEEDGSRQPKLLDFGIVKLGRDGRSHITEAGLVVGSPDYMSPEQARGQEDVDHRSDVWAFSVSLYEAISGRPPFSGNNYNALLRQIVEGSPPTLHELGFVDEELSSIVALGLSKRPEQRGTIAQTGEALASWLLKQGITEDICGTVLAGRWLRGAAEIENARALQASWPPESSSHTRRIALPPAPSAAPPRDAIKTVVRGASSAARFRKLGLGLALALLALLALAVVHRALQPTLAAPPAGERASSRTVSASTMPHDPSRSVQDRDFKLAPIVRIEDLPREPQSEAQKKGKGAARAATEPSARVESSGESDGTPAAPAASPNPAPPSPAKREPQELMDPY